MGRAPQSYRAERHFCPVPLSLSSLRVVTTPLSREADTDARSVLRPSLDTDYLSIVARLLSMTAVFLDTDARSVPFAADARRTQLFGRAE